MGHPITTLHLPSYPAVYFYSKTRNLSSRIANIPNKASKNPVMETTPQVRCLASGSTLGDLRKDGAVVDLGSVGTLDLGVDGASEGVAEVALGGSVDHLGLKSLLESHLHEMVFRVTYAGGSIIGGPGVEANLLSVR
jgi:hypothetical protein